MTLVPENKVREAIIGIVSSIGILHMPMRPRWKDGDGNDFIPYFLEAWIQEYM